MPDSGWFQTAFNSGWPVIKGAPIQFTGCVIFLAIVAWLLARWEFSRRLENAKESRDHYKDKADRLTASPLQQTSIPTEQNNDNKPETTQLRGNYQVTDAAKEEAEFVGMLSRMNSEELKNADPKFVARLNAIPYNKYPALPDYPNLPERHVDTLEKRAFELAKEICVFLKLHGAEPTLEEGKIFCKEHGKEILDWHWEKIQPWRTRVGAGYRAHLADKVEKIKDELAEQGLMDSELNRAIQTRIYTEKDIRTIAERLRFVASHLEC
jgi:hypothetical protein